MIRRPTPSRRDFLGGLSAAAAASLLGLTCPHAMARVPRGLGILGNSSAFDPLSLSPALWLKADAGTFQTSGGSAATADGDPVGQFLDQSGNGRHYLQATSSKRPTLRLNTQNGLPGILFDGTDDYLQGPAFSAGSNCTILLAVKPGSTTPIGLFDSAPSNANTIRNFSAGKWDWHNQQPHFDLALANTNAVVLCFRHTLAPSRAVDYFRNASLVGNNTNASTTAASWTSPAIGGVNLAVSGAYAGHILELLIYPAALSDANCVGGSNYLRSRWGTA